MTECESDSSFDRKQVNRICSELRQLLMKAVKRNLGSGILLSGGLDTSILASIGSEYTSLRAFTVAFDEGEARDLSYARLVADELGLEHSIYLFRRAEVLEAIPQVIAATCSFDPMEIRNDVAIFIALRQAMSSDLTHVMTGDGCDELFAGYSFFFGYDEEMLQAELERIRRIMVFSSVPLAKMLGAEAKLPYLDPEVRSFAMNLNHRYLIRCDKGRKWGKWILRKAFEEVLPKEVVWRAKTPVECGTGTSILPKIFDMEISNEKFNRRKKKHLEEDRVTLRDKEQLFYYEVYREVVGVPHPEDPYGKLCPMCNSNVRDRGTYCTTCGAYPI